jgi:hypothetical protein
VSKLILMSILIAMVVVPTRAAREPNPRKGLRRVVIEMLIFQAVYALSMVYLWGRW